MGESPDRLLVNIRHKLVRSTSQLWALTPAGASGASKAFGQIFGNAARVQKRLVLRPLKKFAVIRHNTIIGIGINRHAKLRKSNPENRTSKNGKSVEKSWYKMGVISRLFKTYLKPRFQAPIFKYFRCKESASAGPISFLFKLYNLQAEGSFGGLVRRA